MVVIRLARGGTKKSPFYHLVVADQRRPRDGKFIERLGYFNPQARGQDLRMQVNEERITFWIHQGAQPSERVKSLLKQFTKDPAAAQKASLKKGAFKQQQVAASLKQAKKAAKAKTEESTEIQAEAEVAVEVEVQETKEESSAENSE